MDKNIDSIMNFWMTVEYLQPQEVPKLNPREFCFRAESEEKLPWNDATRLQKIEKKLAQLSKNKSGKTHKAIHHIYCGLYDASKLASDLGVWFGQTDKDREFISARMKRAAAVLIKADQNGLVLDVSISSTPWAMGMLNPSKKSNLRPFGGESGFETTTKDQIASMLSDWSLVDSETGRSERVFRNVDLQDCLDVASHLFSAVEWSPSSLETGCLINTVFPRTDSEDASDDMLNSFIVDDLEAVRLAISRGAVGNGLRTYLSDPSKLPIRTDVQSDRWAATVQGVSPDRFPSGRWPSAHPLAVAQQFAVNSAFQRLANGGIFSVNGPPGTGKTTLLKDVVAGVITERAKVLASFDNPRNAFSNSFRLPGAYSNSYELSEKLKGFGIVVASSNNAAIENVTMELPGEKSISVGDFKIDYFKSISDRLLANGTPNIDPSDDDSESLPPREVKTWGLISAPLGRSANRSRFANIFWFGNEKDEDGKPLDTLKTFLSRSSDSSETGWIKARTRFNNLLSEVEQTQSDLQNIFRAALEFRSIGERSFDDERAVLNAALSASRQKYESIIGEKDRQKIELESLQATQSSDDSYRRLATQKSSLVRTISDLSKSFPNLKAIPSSDDLRALKARLQRDYNIKFASRPSWLQQIFNRAVKTTWQSECQAASDSLHRLEHLVMQWRQLGKTQQSLSEMAVPHISADILRHQIEKNSSTVANLEIQAITVAKEIQGIQSSINALHAQERNRQRLATDLDSQLRRHQINMSDLNAWLGNVGGDQFQLSSPWSTTKFLKLRHQLLQAALELHKAFFMGAHREMSANLSVAADLLQGKAVPQRGDVSHIWDSLFLVVPVVSTTFASCSRMFKGLEQEEIGWLLVDEAGQATPQSAVGAIWRAKRSVIVGDPLQLEPVVSLPEHAVLSLCKAYKVNDKWNPQLSSVQTLADTVNPIGTFIGRGLSRIWVGSPLIVHRRCTNPMFAISNEIAYDGLMVYGTNSKSAANSDSRWIDKKPNSNNGHWVPNQGTLALEIVKDIASSRGVRDKDGNYNIFVITPYRDIAAEMDSLLKNAGFDDKISGTVNTFQGREARTVVFLLGGDPKKKRAVSSFAAKSPNLVNVAVTRAKTELIVIGDKDLWADAPYFKQMEERLQARG
jgi:hypothetical protein